MAIKKISIVILLIISIGYACQLSYCDKLISAFDKIACNLEYEKCLIDMRSIFKGKWDYVYIFHGFNTPEDISSTIGCPYDGAAIYDHMRLVLYVFNDKVVYSTHMECTKLNLDKAFTNGYVKIDKNRPQMYISKKYILNNYTYILEFP
jgi:hypothetical protein